MQKEVVHWDGMTLEEAFLDLLDKDHDAAVRMMNAMPEIIRKKYRDIYTNWRNKQE